MGGVSSPFIIHYPKELGRYSGEIRSTPAHIIDITPTALSLAGVEYPKTFAGEKITPPDGVDITPIIKGGKIKKRDLFFEHQTSCAIISDGWKLVRANLRTDWELFNLSKDPFEQSDLSTSEPKMLKKLEAKWNAWAEENNVFPLETREWTTRIRYYKSLYPVAE